MPVHVVAFDDQQVFEAALVENIQRSDLNPIEKAQGFKRLPRQVRRDAGQLGAKLGLDRTTVSNLLGLLNLPPEVQDAVRLGQITLGHAKVLKGVPDAGAAGRPLPRDDPEELLGPRADCSSSSSSNGAAAAAAPQEPEEREPAEKTAHVKGIEDDLRQRLAVKIEIKVKAKDKGQIVHRLRLERRLRAHRAGAAEVRSATGGTVARPRR